MMEVPYKGAGDKGKMNMATEFFFVLTLIPEFIHSCSTHSIDMSSLGSNESTAAKSSSIM